MAGRHARQGQHLLRSIMCTTHTERTTPLSLLALEAVPKCQAYSGTLQSADSSLTQTGVASNDPVHMQRCAKARDRQSTESDQQAIGKKAAPLIFRFQNQQTQSA